MYISIKIDTKDKKIYLFISSIHGLTDRSLPWENLKIAKILSRLIGQRHFILKSRDLRYRWIKVFHQSKAVPCRWRGGGGYCMHAAIYFIVCRHNAVPELPSRAVDMFTRQTLYYIRGKDPYTYTAREHIIL